MSNFSRTGKRAKQVKALVAKSDGLSSIPRTQIMEGESQFLQVVLYMCAVTNTHTCAHASIHTYPYIQTYRERENSDLNDRCTPSLRHSKLYTTPSVQSLLHTCLKI